MPDSHERLGRIEDRVSTLAVTVGQQGEQISEVREDVADLQRAREQDQRDAAAARRWRRNFSVAIAAVVVSLAGVISAIVVALGGSHP